MYQIKYLMTGYRYMRTGYCWKADFGSNYRPWWTVDYTDHPAQNWNILKALGSLCIVIYEYPLSQNTSKIVQILVFLCFKVTLNTLSTNRFGPCSWNKIKYLPVGTFKEYRTTPTHCVNLQVILDLLRIGNVGFELHTFKVLWILYLEIFLTHLFSGPFGVE